MTCTTPLVVRTSVRVTVAFVAPALFFKVTLLPANIVQELTKYKNDDQVYIGVRNVRCKREREREREENDREKESTDTDGDSKSRGTSAAQQSGKNLAEFQIYYQKICMRQANHRFI
jgi:hypothetical protein